MEKAVTCGVELQSLGIVMVLMLCNGDGTMVTYENVVCMAVVR